MTISFNEVIARFNKNAEKLNLEGVTSYLADRIVELPGESMKLVAVVGGAGAGKSTLAENLVEELRARGIAADHISTDGFLRSTKYERGVIERTLGPLAKYDFRYMKDCIDKIRKGEEDIRIPTRKEGEGFAIAAGGAHYKHIQGKLDCLIVEGDFDMAEHPDLRGYLHTADDVRLRNRIERDARTRGESDPHKTAVSFHKRQRLQHFPYTMWSIKVANIILDAAPTGNGYHYSVYEAPA